MRISNHAGLFLLVLAALTIGCSRAPGSNVAPVATEKEATKEPPPKPAPPPTKHVFVTHAPQEPQPTAKPEAAVSPTTASNDEDEIDELIEKLGGKRIDREKSEKSEPEADAGEPPSGNAAIKKMVERLKGKYESAKDESNRTVISISLADTAVTDEDLALLKRATNLVSLDLSGAIISDAGIANLKGLTELTSLNLNATNVTGAGLVHIQSLTKLRRLDISFGFGTGGDSESIVHAIGPNLDDASLKYLKRLTKLVDLNLDNCRIGDEGLAHLAELTNLEKLHLSATDITNDGLGHLKSLSSLRDLDISENEDITNAALTQLKALAQLETLNADGTKISAAALARFKRTLKTSPKSTADSGKSDKGTMPKAGDSAPAARGSLPKYFDKLDLSAEQREKVAKTTKQYDDKVASMKQKMSDAKGLPGATSIVIAGANAIKKLNIERQKALEEILTDEQRSKLRQLRSNN